MLWTPKAPALAPRPLGTPLPRKLPISLHPSCVLALLPQNDPKWFDNSGRGNHGVVHGATPTAKGPQGFAWGFDGVDDWIDCGNHPSLNPPRITIVARVKFGTIPYASQIGIDRSSSYRLIAGDVHSFRLSARFATTNVGWGAGLLVGATLLKANIWYPIAFTYDGSHAKVWLNGVEDGSRAATGDLVTEPLKNVIGNFNGLAGFWFNGLIDYVLIYNQAWSPRPADANYLPEIDPFL